MALTVGKLKEILSKVTDDSLVCVYPCGDHEYHTFSRAVLGSAACTDLHGRRGNFYEWAGEEHAGNMTECKVFVIDPR